MKHLLTILIILPAFGFAQSTVSLTNKILYKNGDRYIDPSINYAGTGFVVDYSGQM